MSEFRNPNEFKSLPNATLVLVFGIVSIVTSCCYGIIGIVFAIVGIVVSNQDLRLYKESPNSYTNYDQLNAGRILSFIGLGINALIILIMVFVMLIAIADSM